MSHLDHFKVPLYEEEISTRVDKETKAKVEELKRQIRLMKGTDSLITMTFVSIHV